MKPQTVHDALEMLKTYHQQRRDLYRRLEADAPDEWTEILLKELVRLEDNSVQVIGDEIERLKPHERSYLLSGPTPTIPPTHAMDCRCDSDPTFEDILSCSLCSDEALDELIDLIGVASAAPSVQELATALRELVRTKDRQIAKFSRTD
jgi:hypothetical protein